MAQKAAWLVGVLVAGAVVDGAWLSRLPWGAGPDLLIIVVVLAGLRHGVEVGALLGAAAGYLRDLVSGSPLGLFTLTYVLLGAGAGAVSPMVNLQQRLVPLAAVLWGTLLVGLMTAVIVNALGLGTVAWTTAAYDAALAATFNGLLTGPMAGLLRWVNRVTARRYTGRTIGHKVLR